MNINNAFPSTFIKAADLKGKSVSVSIDHVAFERVGDEQKLVMYFAGSDRGLVLNKTNANITAEMYGPETDDWTGKPVTLFPARVEYAGKIVDAIRIKLVQVEQAAAFSQAPFTKPAAPAQPRNGAVNGFGHAPEPPPHEGFQDDRVPF